MKTISLTMLQAVRLAVMLDQHQGARKDLRMLRDVRERLGLSDERLAALMTPVNGGMMVLPEVAEMPPVELAIVPEEARRIIEILDRQVLTVRDLKWAEPLAKDLEGASA